MNKKNLSVVMAGAMLATSVAPVLADSTNTYEVTSGNVGLLIDKLDTYFEEAPKFDKDTNLNGSLAGEPVYAYQVREVGKTTWENGDLVSSITTDRNGTTETALLKTELNSSKEYELRVIDRGHRTNADGKIVSKEALKTEYVDVYKKYEVSTSDSTVGEFEHITKAVITALKAGDIKNTDIDEVKYPDLKGLEKLFKDGKITSVKRTLSNSEDTLTSFSSEDNMKQVQKVVLVMDGGSEVVLDGNTDKYNFEAPKKEDENITGFEKKSFGKEESNVVGSDKDIEETTLYTVKIVKGDTKVDYKITDLYDGFMLTDAGHALLTEMKEVDAKEKAAGNNTKYDVVVENDGLAPLNNKFSVTIKNNGTTKVVTITATTDEAAKLSTLKTWLEDRKATVDILAGSNRYATAVEIAKTYVADSNNQYTEGGSVGKTKKIVLVNGEALVDGLAAAPYAKQNNAPILLTADNKLPAETKEYLKEIVKGANIVVGDADSNKNTLPTITIIGGTSVVSSSVVDELKALGFKVDRIAGDNREQTSREVAEEMGTSGDVFVVGAEGEADAMSIASYAAASETPIIVSKSATNGLSTMAVNDIKDIVGSNGTVTIIGGTAAVPENTEAVLEESGIKEANIERIAGERRQETNALVIKEFHKGFSSVLVSKDGTNKKSELVDALPVSIFASVNATASAGKTTAAPIVLATNSLSDSQLNNLVLNSIANKSTGTVYQVGGGVARSVMEKVVTKLGLNN